MKGRKFRGKEKARTGKKVGFNLARKVRVQAFITSLVVGSRRAGFVGLAFSVNSLEVRARSPHFCQSRFGAGKGFGADFDELGLGLLLVCGDLIDFGEEGVPALSG